jgi:hypothetical protein
MHCGIGAKIAASILLDGFHPGAFARWPHFGGGIGELKNERAGGPLSQYRMHHHDRTAIPIQEWVPKGEVAHDLTGLLAHEILVLSLC